MWWNPFWPITAQDSMMPCFACLTKLLTNTLVFAGGICSPTSRLCTQSNCLPKSTSSDKSMVFAKPFVSYGV